MIAAVLEHLCTKIEAAGLSWGSFVLDGSSAQKRVSWGLVDPDLIKAHGLAVGIDFRSPTTQPIHRPPFSPPTNRAIDPSAGTVQVEPGLEWVSRLLQIHLYMHETRKDAERTGYSINTQYLKNEGRLLNALGMTRSDYFIPVNGITRGFSTHYEGNPFQSEPGLSLHSVFSYRATYPILEGVETIEAYMAKRIRLIDQVEPGTPIQLDPLGDLPPGARLTVIE